jgi:hypothetical protein
MQNIYPNKRYPAMDDFRVPNEDTLYTLDEDFYTFIKQTESDQA